jgi:hypothetical protein
MNRNRGNKGKGIKHAAKLKEPRMDLSILGYLRLGFFFFIFIKCPKSSEYDITTNPGKGR